jgi:HEAT repeat protein
MKDDNLPEATIEEIVASLSDLGQPLSNADLASLNDLKSDELASLKSLWPSIDEERRREIVIRLVTLAEDDPRLNFDAIFKSLLKDNDAEVRRQAIEGLWEDEEPSLVGLLADVLEGDDDTEVRAAAAKGLRPLAAMAALGELRSDAEERLGEVLLEAISEKNPTEVRRRALEAAAALDLPSLNDAIKEAYVSRDPRFKSSAIFAMGSSGDPIWMPILVAELKSDNPETRYEAATACGELAEEGCVPHLIRLLEDDDVEVRLAVIRALGEIGGTMARKGVQACLKSPSEAVRELAAEVLAQLDEDEEGLSFHLEDDEEELEF